MPLVDNVRAISQSSTTITSNAEVVEFIKSGASFIINNVPRSKLRVAATGNSVTSSAAYSLGTEKIVSVKRNGIECDELDEKLAYAHSTAVTGSSLFAGTSIFPKWYRRGNEAYIVPAPTTAQTGAFYTVKIPSITSATASTVLVEFHNPMLLYAAALDCMAMSGFFSVDVMNTVKATSPVDDALQKAQYIIDASTELSQGEDVEGYISSEDTEMMNANVQVAAQELNRAMAVIQRDRKAGIDSYAAQYVEKANNLFKQAIVEVNNIYDKSEEAIKIQTLLALRRNRST